jgi:uncharacterized protein (DUF2267 family)
MKFEQYAAEASHFMKEVAEELENPRDENHAYRVTRTVFHTIRDILTPEGSTHLMAQLPMYLKALYVDGWKLGPKDRIRSMKEFLANLRARNDRPELDFGNDSEAIKKVQAVLAVLQKHVTTGEITHIMDQFPGELMEIWKAPVHENT